MCGTAQADVADTHTGATDQFKLASWAAMSPEGEKIAMKSKFKAIWQNGGRGISKNSLVDVDVGGEDSHFIDDANGFIGVADGVGDERLQGDSGIYSRLLMYNAQRITSKRGRQEDLFELLMDAKDASETPGLSGKSTMLLLRLLPSADKSLESNGEERSRIVGANIGDSCALLVRPGDGVIAEAPRQKIGKAPHQLPDHPEGTIFRDRYDFEWPVQDGDLVVAGSDGLFDNLYPQEITQTVHRLLAQPGNPTPREFSKRVAEELQRLVRQKVFNLEPPPEPEAHAMLSLEKPFPTPHMTEKVKDFVQQRRMKKGIPREEAEKLGCWGGKEDDTTIIVSRVTVAPHPDETIPPGLTNVERGKIVQ